MRQIRLILEGTPSHRASVASSISARPFARSSIVNTNWSLVEPDHSGVVQVGPAAPSGTFEEERQASRSDSIVRLSPPDLRGCRSAEIFENRIKGKNCGAAPNDLFLGGVLSRILLVWMLPGAGERHKMLLALPQRRGFRWLWEDRLPEYEIY